MENKMKLDNYPFYGWDYIELAIAWNLYIPDVDNIDVIADHKPIKWFLNCVLDGARNNGTTMVMKKVASDLRIFLSKLGDENNTCGNEYPMWKGMSKIESDYTIIRLAIPLIGYMWD